MGLVFSVLAAYIAMWVVAYALYVHGHNPLPSLPFTCAAFAVLTFMPRRIKGKPAQILERMDSETAATMSRLRVIDQLIGFTSAGVAIWAMLFQTAPWITALILAHNDPSAWFFQATYPGWSMVCMMAASFSTGVLVARFVVWRKAGRHLNAWLDYSTSGNLRLGNRPRLVLWINTLTVAISLAFLAAVLPCGVGVGPEGISVRRFGHTQPSFYQWKDVREAAYVDAPLSSLKLVVKLADGSELVMGRSMYDDKSNVADIGKELERRHKFRF